MKTVLVVGAGGREHALCWKLAQSDHVETIYCAPGNGGTASTLKTQNIPIAVSDFETLAQFAKERHVDLAVIGPDNPLAEGIVDVFDAHGILTFGPNQHAAQLESSKAFAKQFMKANNLPTARFEVFEDKAQAAAFCQQNDWARVIKVDGLALGKGVFVCDTLADCDVALSDIFDANRFGASAARVLVEERLYGPEISLLMLCDGQRLLPLAPSQDYKRRFEGNQGPNTGGMGVFSPVPLYDTLETQILEQVVRPLEQALQAADFTFKGLLYAGLLIHEGQPYLLEFNARFGDPETQCLLPRLQSDLFELLEASAKGDLSNTAIQWAPEASVCVVLCAQNYPESSSQNKPISIEALPQGVTVFHAGTKLEFNQLLTSGGRVLNVVALGTTHEAAAQRAYSALTAIAFEDMAYRRDIAKDVALCPSA